MRERGREKEGSQRPEKVRERGREKERRERERERKVSKSLEIKVHVPLTVKESKKQGVIKIAFLFSELN